MTTFHSLANRTALVLCCGALLAGCDVNKSNNGVRTGPQAVHPSPSGLAQSNPAIAAQFLDTSTQPVSNAQVVAKAKPAAGDDLAKSLFRDFCKGKRTAAASEAAIVSSGRFNPPLITEFKVTNGRYVNYVLKENEKASVTVITGSASGIQCGVGVNNRGQNLYEDGAISFSG
jgi:hypothetical protein